MRWIVMDDVFNETWRRLLEFSNLDLTFDEIARRHGSPSKSEIENYKKQALQVRACVLQAKEYFDAARTSSLFTRGNHAYYGAVALASLIMLIRGDGTKSLDYLRGNQKNNHHGLEFTIACDARGATNGIKLLQHSYSEVLRHGHFANWYETMPEIGNVSSIINTISAQGTAYKSMGQVGGFQVAPINSIVGEKKSLVDLLKYLPDMADDLVRFGIDVAYCRSDLEVTNKEGGQRQVTHVWRLHGCRSPADLEAILSQFVVQSSFTDSITCKLGGPNSALVTVSQARLGEFHLTWPDGRDTMNCDTITYADTINSLEIVDLYLIAYQLSMLSRYFPDIWIRCIESQCRAAKLVERAVDLIIKKMPMLALSFISMEDVVISTHLPPWKI